MIYSITVNHFEEALSSEHIVYSKLKLLLLKLLLREPTQTLYTIENLVVLVACYFGLFHDKSNVEPYGYEQ